MLELIFQFFGEILLQIFLEVLVELGLHSTGRSRRPVNPWLAAVGYAVLGALLGGLSLWVMPELLIPEPGRVLNLVIAPILVGLMMVGLGAWRARRGDPVLRIDRFVYGYLFALALALVRFQFAG